MLELKDEIGKLLVLIIFFIEKKFRNLRGEDDDIR